MCSLKPNWFTKSWSKQNITLSKTILSFLFWFLKVNIILSNILLNWNKFFIYIMTHSRFIYKFHKNDMVSFFVIDEIGYIHLSHLRDLYWCQLDLNTNVSFFVTAVIDILKVHFLFPKHDLLSFCIFYGIYDWWKGARICTVWSLYLSIFSSC